MTAILLRIFGPRLIGAMPWRLIAIIALIAGVAASYWAVDDHGKRVQRDRDAAVINGVRADLGDREREGGSE